MSELLDKGCKKQKLRAHSDLLPNDKVNDWALSFNENFDIQTETKAKNLIQRGSSINKIRNYLLSKGIQSKYIKETIDKINELNNYIINILKIKKKVKL